MTARSSASLMDLSKVEIAASIVDLEWRVLTWVNSILLSSDLLKVCQFALVVTIGLKVKLNNHWEVVRRKCIHRADVRFRITTIRDSNIYR